VQGVAKLLSCVVCPCAGSFSERFAFNVVGPGGGNSGPDRPSAFRQRAGYAQVLHEEPHAL